MKKIIIMALAMLPLFSIAQEKGAPTSSAPAKPNDNKFAIENPEVVYLELILSTNSVGAQTIKVDFGREILASIGDKDLTKNLAEMRSMSFPSVPDAMNYLASIGFKFQQNYQTIDKEGKTDTHIVYEKRLGRKPNTDGTMTKPRPERPAEGAAKPGTETDPKERTPVTKPAEKGKK